MYATMPQDNQQFEMYITNTIGKIKIKIQEQNNTRKHHTQRTNISSQGTPNYLWHVNQKQAILSTLFQYKKMYKIKTKKKQRVNGWDDNYQVITKMSSPHPIYNQ